VSSKATSQPGLRLTDQSSAWIRAQHPEAQYIPLLKEWDLRSNDERELAIALHRSRIDQARREGLFEDEHTQTGEIPGAFN